MHFIGVGTAELVELVGKQPNLNAWVKLMLACGLLHVKGGLVKKTRFPI